MTETTGLGSRSFRLGVLWTLLAASVLMALPALDGGLLGYDDENLIVGAPGGVDAALERGPLSFFTREYYYAYLPFYGLSYWVDGKLGAGPDHPFLFRFANVLWHAAAGFVAFAVLARLLRSRVAALLGALVFVVHPLHVESVAWISGRKDVLSGFFFLFAWLLWLGAEDGRRGFRAGAIAAFLVACFTKASAVVLPAVLVATALLLPRYEGRRRRAALATWPLWVAAALPVAVHLSVGASVGVVGEPAPLGARLAAFVAGWGDTVRRALVPWGLSIDYPEAGETGRLWWPALWLAGAVAAVLFLRRRAPVVAAGAAVFLVALAPFNNVFPWTGTIVADRYAYLPILGLSLVVGRAASLGHEWRLGLSAAVVVLLGLSAWSAGRFESDEKLWTATIRSRPDSALAYLQRGIERVNAAVQERPHPEDKLESGADDVRKALARIPPGSARSRAHRAKAHAALADAQQLLGDGDGAVEHATKAIGRIGKPQNADERRFLASVLRSRARTYERAGLAAAAARDYLAAAKRRSTYDSWLKAGEMLKAARRPELARHALERAANIDRTSPEAHVLLADVHRQLGDRAARKEALDEASRRDRDAPVVVEGWVWFWLDAKSPDFEKAAEELLRLDRTSAVAERLGAEVAARRALYKFRRGDLEGAVDAADVARLQGGATPQALYDLGQIYLEAGRFDDAVACYRTAEDALESRSVYRDAIARAYALEAYRHLVAERLEEARATMRSALAARPSLIDAGAAPLRGEIERLRESAEREPDLLLLAVAAVAGDPEQGDLWAGRMTGREMRPADRALLLHLRALVRGFTPPFRFDQAKEDLRSALDLLPGDRWARYRLAQIQVRAGVDWNRVARQVGSEQRAREAKAHLERAVEQLSKLLEEDPDFHLARLQRGEAHFALGDEIAAKADYEALRDRGARLRESWLKEAVLHRYRYVRGGDVLNLTDALELLDRALQRDPHYFDALFETGNVYHLLYDRQDDPSRDRRRAFTQAILAYRRAMALNPRQPEPRTEWARILLKAARAAAAANKLTPAHELLQRVEEEVDDVPELFKERVRLNMRPEFHAETGIEPAEFFPQARRALDRLEELAPHDPELPGIRALFYRRLGWNHYLQWAKLELVAREGGEEIARRRAKVRERAVEAWVQALRAWPEDPENDAVRRRLRELAPGITVFDEKRAKQAFVRGRRAFDRGEYEDAADAFREALLLFPESTAIRYSYAAALLEGGRFTEAKDPLVKVATSGEAKRFPEALYELGRLYDRSGEPAIAKQWFHRFLEAMEAAERGDDPRVAWARERLETLGKAARGANTENK